MLELYQKICQYPVTDFIQKLDINIDIEQLRKDIFQLIIKNNYQFNIVSLRLPPDRDDWDNQNEMLETGAIDPFHIRHELNNPDNTIPNDHYTNWHPDVTESIKHLVDQIQEYTGLGIGRVRLGWLMPGKGYPVHSDLEPMRIHIPIMTNKLAYMLHDGNLTHMEYGSVYHLLTPNIHTAWNFGRFPRLHLIFSTNDESELINDIDKLKQINTTSTNYLDHIKEQGVDHYSLIKLIEITGKDPNNKFFGEAKILSQLLKGK